MVRFWRGFLNSDPALRLLESLAPWNKLDDLGLDIDVLD
jgi:hypothetical protein